MVDIYSLIPTDTIQIVMTIASNNYANLAIVDSGASKIVMDTQVAERYRLTVLRWYQGIMGNSWSLAKA